MTTAAICATREVSWRPSFYRGEQYDADLGLYYLRARYYNPATGRFLSRDPEDGKATDPASLHKYLYANGDPVNMADPTGRGTEWESFLLSAAIVGQVAIQKVAGMDPNSVLAAVLCVGEDIGSTYSAIAGVLNEMFGLHFWTISDGVNLTPFEQWCNAMGH
jgi:RHS repeat-associated protein